MTIKILQVKIGTFNLSFWKREDKFEWHEWFSGEPYKTSPFLSFVRTS